MTSDRIKEIQEQTAYPESVSVKQALLQVWNECQQQLEKEREKIKEAYTDGFSDSRFDFDIENYTQNQE